MNRYLNNLFARAIAIALAVSIIIPPVGMGAHFTPQRFSLAPESSKNVQRESYQIALLLDLWKAWNAGEKQSGVISFNGVKERIEKFNKKNLETYRRSLGKGVSRKEKERLVGEFQKDLESHAIIPESLYVRADGRLSGWFNDPESRFPAVVEVRRHPDIINVWDDPVSFTRDFVHDEDLTPFLSGWLAQSGVPVSAYAADLAESPLITPRRTLIGSKELKRIMLETDFETVHEISPGIPSVRQQDPLKDAVEREARAVLDGALRKLADSRIPAQILVRPPFDLKNKKVRFVHHEELMDINSYRASWVLPDEPDTICVAYEFWRVLSEPQRETLLAQEIVRSEALRTAPDEAGATEAADKAALALDPGKRLNRRLEDILKDYRIYNGVDRIELIITHPHGDHSSYVSNYIRGRMQKNLVARPVPALSDKLKLELGNKFTHEVTSYLLRPTKRVVTIFDMGGYKGEGADPFIETVNPHYRIGNKHFMKPVTIYADRATARTLEFQKRLAAWQKEGLKVELKIFEEDGGTMTVTDGDFNKVEMTAWPAYHLPGEIGSSVYNMKKVDREGRRLSSFSLVSEIGDVFSYATSPAAIREIAKSDIIAIDGTNFSSPPDSSPVPIRLQDNKVQQFTDRLNRSWAMVSHLNTSRFGAVAEALEASRTLDPEIPIIIFAGRDGIEDLKKAYEKTSDGRELIKQDGDLASLDSALLRRDSRGAKIYFVSDMAQYLEAWKGHMSKGVQMQDVLVGRLRQMYRAGRTVQEAGEYLEDGAKNPGLSRSEFIWLADELQKTEWDIFSPDDMIESFTNRLKHNIRDYFSDQVDSSGNYLWNPLVEKWARDILLKKLDDFVDANRAAWKSEEIKTLPKLLRDAFNAFLKKEIAGREISPERNYLLQLKKAFKNKSGLDVQTEGIPRVEAVERCIDAIRSIVDEAGLLEKMPEKFLREVKEILTSSLYPKSWGWESFDQRQIPILILEESQRLIDQYAGKKAWGPNDTQRLINRLVSELLLLRKSGSAIPGDVLKRAFLEMFEEGAVPEGESERFSFVSNLAKMDRNDPRVITALVRLMGKDTSRLNETIASALLDTAAGRKRFDVRIEDVHLSKKEGLTKGEAAELLEAWSAHPWAKLEYEVDWVETLLDKCLSAGKTVRPWIGLDAKDISRQLVYAINHSDLDRWAPEQIDAISKKIFNIKNLPEKERDEIVFNFIAAVTDSDTKTKLMGYLGAQGKREFISYARQRGMRMKGRQDVKAIETALWELAKTGSGKALIIGTGHFGSAQQKASQLLNQIFYKRYAEVLIEGRPRTEGRQGKIPGQFITREEMALLGKIRPIRARHEHQWMSGHITFEEAVKLLELIYNARIEIEAFSGRPDKLLLPQRGVDRISYDDLDMYEKMLMRILFTTSSKLGGDEDEGVKFLQNLSEDKRRILQKLGKLFAVLEIGAGRKTINISGGKWDTKEYARPIPREGTFLRQLYDRAVKGAIEADLSNLVSSKKPAEYAEDLARIKEMEDDGPFERLRSLERYFDSQVLRLGLRIGLDYGSQRVIEEEEIGVIPEDPAALEKFMHLPLEAKGLYFQFAHAVEEVVRPLLDEEVYRFIKTGIDRYFDQPATFFDQDGRLTGSLEPLVRRYTEPGFAKVAVLVDPMKRWAQSNMIDFRIDLPRSAKESDRLFEFLRKISLEQIHQLTVDAEKEMNILRREGDFTIDFQGFALERKGGTLTLSLAGTPAAVEKQEIIEPRGEVFVDGAALAPKSFVQEFAKEAKARDEERRKELIRKSNKVKLGVITALFALTNVITGYSPKNNVSTPSAIHTPFSPAAPAAAVLTPAAEEAFNLAVKNHIEKLPENRKKDYAERSYEINKKSIYEMGNVLFAQLRIKRAPETGGEREDISYEYWIFDNESGNAAPVRLDIAPLSPNPYRTYYDDRLAPKYLSADGTLLYVKTREGFSDKEGFLLIRVADPARCAVVDEKYGLVELKDYFFDSVRGKIVYKAPGSPDRISIPLDKLEESVRSAIDRMEAGRKKIYLAGYELQMDKSYEIGKIVFISLRGKAEGQWGKGFQEYLIYDAATGKSSEVWYAANPHRYEPYSLFPLSRVLVPRALSADGSILYCETEPDKDNPVSYVLVDLRNKNNYWIFEEKLGLVEGLDYLFDQSTGRIRFLRYDRLIQKCAIFDLFFSSGKVKGAFGALSSDIISIISGEEYYAIHGDRILFVAQITQGEGMSSMTKDRLAVYNIALNRSVFVEVEGEEAITKYSPPKISSDGKTGYVRYLTKNGKEGYLLVKMDSPMDTIGTGVIARGEGKEGVTHKFDVNKGELKILVPALATAPAVLPAPGEEPGLIGKAYDVQSVTPRFEENRIEVLAVDNDTKMEETITLDVTSRGPPAKERLKSIIDSVPETYRPSIEKIMRKIPPYITLATYGNLNKDLFGFAFPVEHLIALHDSLADNPVALFHEILEYLIKDGKLLPGEVERLLDPAGLKWFYDHEKKYADIGQSEYFIKNRNHFINRALARQIFGALDRDLTYAIKGLQPGLKPSADKINMAKLAALSAKRTQPALDIYMRLLYPRKSIADLKPEIRDRLPTIVYDIARKKAETALEKVLNIYSKKYALDLAGLRDKDKEQLIIASYNIAFNGLENDTEAVLSLLEKLMPGVSLSHVIEMSWMMIVLGKKEEEIEDKYIFPLFKVITAKQVIEQLKREILIRQGDAGELPGEPEKAPAFKRAVKVIKPAEQVITDRVFKIGSAKEVLRILVEMGVFGSDQDESARKFFQSLMDATGREYPAVLETLGVCANAGTVRADNLRGWLDLFAALAKKDIKSAGDYYTPLRKMARYFSANGLKTGALDPAMLLRVIGRKPDAEEWRRWCIGLQICLHSAANAGLGIDQENLTAIYEDLEAEYGSRTAVYALRYGLPLVKGLIDSPGSFERYSNGFRYANGFAALSSKAGDAAENLFKEELAALFKSAPPELISANWDIAVAAASTREDMSVGFMMRALFFFTDLYKSGKSPDIFYNDIRKKAAAVIKRGIDYTDPQERFLAYFWLKNRGNDSLTWSLFEAHLEELAEFDRKNPGAFRMLYAGKGFQFASAFDRIRLLKLKPGKRVTKPSLNDDIGSLTSTNISP